MRAQALDGERPCDPDDLVVLVRLVVQVLEVRLRGDRSIDLLLALDAKVPPLAVERDDLLVLPRIDRVGMQ